jgi:hypothetical protein
MVGEKSDPHPKVDKKRIREEKRKKVGYIKQGEKTTNQPNQQRESKTKKIRGFPPASPHPPQLHFTVDSTVDRP